MAYTVTEDSRGDWYRTIVSLRSSIDVFADLVSHARDARVLVEHELATKPTTAAAPIISRPFEETPLYDAIREAIAWPFEHPCRSRYSDGTFGVWYGARSLETSIRETVHHFRRNTLASAAATRSRVPIAQDRRVHLVHCSAMLIDLRASCERDPRLLDPNDYTFCQALGAQLRAASQPGVLTHSARHEAGEVTGVFERAALSDPRDVCYLTYILDPVSGRVDVERTPGDVQWSLGSQGAA